MRWGRWAVAMVLISLLSSPIVSADLSMENQSLNLVCSNDVCSLSTQAAGDSVLSGEEREANPAQPVTVVLEFRMSPGQTTVSLLPVSYTHLTLPTILRV